MRPVFKHIRSELGNRVLPWIDDFLCAPTDGRRPAIGRDCRGARIQLESLFGELGLTRHPGKGFLEGTQVLEHLGVLIDTRQMRVFVTEQKVVRMRKMAKELLLCAQRNRRLVSMEKVRHFLWGGGFVDFCPAHGTLIHQKHLLGPEFLAWMRAGERGPIQREVRRTGRVKRSPGGGPSVISPKWRSAQRGTWVSAPGDGEHTWQHQRAAEHLWDKLRLSRQSLRDLVLCFPYDLVHMTLCDRHFMLFI
jgi:hypothetical protein